MVSDLDLPLAARFRHWLAGFIDAKGSFRIDGRRHICEFQLRLRADNVDTLQLIRDETRIGRISHVNRTNQCDEAVWSVNAKADCLALADLLDEYPLRAKKARDAALWSAAVRYWVTRCGPHQVNDWGAIEAAAETIKTTRVYDPQRRGAQDTITTGFMSWLGGFVDGEGSFGLHLQNGRSRPTFQLKVRADDQPILAQIRAATGIGALYQIAGSGTVAPRTAWTIANRTVVQQWRDLIYEQAILLWGHKKHDFAIWLEAVDLWLAPDRDWDAIEELRNELRLWQRRNRLTHERVHDTPSR